MPRAAIVAIVGHDVCLLLNMSRYKAVYTLVAAIPRGRVATYGQIARLLGMPRHARQVGYALAATPADLANSVASGRERPGEISPRRKPGYDEFQRISAGGRGRGVRCSRPHFLAALSVAAGYGALSCIPVPSWRYSG